MSYADQYKNAKTQGAAREMVAKYLKLDKEGLQIIGKLMGYTVIPEKVVNKKVMPEYRQYLFDTDEGLVKVAPGGNFDGSTGAMMKVGNVYALTFNGKRDIGGGHKVNDFALEEIPSDIGDEPREPGDENPL